MVQLFRRWLAGCVWPVRSEEIVWEPCWRLSKCLLSCREFLGVMSRLFLSRFFFFFFGGGGGGGKEEEEEKGDVSERRKRIYQTVISAWTYLSRWILSGFEGKVKAVDLYMRSKSPQSSIGIWRNLFPIRVRLETSGYRWCSVYLLSRPITLVADAEEALQG